ncbi:MAG: hypothetical protein MUC88_10075 [Planctomycetes bacterium]|jgi:hypothetical protein|nr:hypothetical protein [Planctomycetota bacterium]
MTAHKRSRLLVVDASVAHSAGQTEHPISSCCRDALLAVLRICHRIVMTEAIQNEWNHHMSRFTRKWFRSMVAKKKVYRCAGVPLGQVDKACDGLSAPEQNSLREDLLLVEAACEGDGIVITRDDAIQAIWRKCQDRLHPPKPIRWVNPVTEGVQALERL